MEIRNRKYKQEIFEGGLPFKVSSEKYFLQDLQKYWIFPILRCLSWIILTLLQCGQK